MSNIASPSSSETRVYLPLTCRGLVMTDAASLAVWADRIDELPRSPLRDVKFSRTVVHLRR